MSLRKIKKFSVITVLSFIFIVPRFAMADEDNIGFIGTSYTTGGAYGISFVGMNIGENGGYGTINLNIHSGSNLPKFAVIDAYGGHLGFMLGGSDEFAVGLGGLWGISQYGTGDGKDVSSGHYGVEIPFMIVPDENLPVFMLPFWEVFVTKSEAAKRYGLNIMANFQAMEPLSIQIEAGLYYNQFKKEGNDSGMGFNWSIGVGIDIW